MNLSKSKAIQNVHKISKMNAKMIIAMFFIVLTAGAGVSAASGKHEKVPIREVSSLLLHRGKMTTGRRASPVPQLNCLSNCQDAPDTIYCSNAGHDGEDVVWECKSDPAGAVLRDLNVQCEGYDYPDDPYILKGSCGIEFSMASPKSSPKYSSEDPDNPIGALFVLIILVAIVSCITGDGGGDSYSHRSSYSSPGYRSSSSNFWTGAATGYAVGRSSRGGSSWGGSSRSSWGGGGGGSSWGGGGSSYARTSRR